MKGLFVDRFESMLETMTNVLSSGDRAATEEWCSEYRRFRVEGERQLGRISKFKGPTTPELSVGVRQRQLAMHIMEPLQKYLATLPSNSVIDGLDADCGYGYGTDLIASLYLTSVLGYRIRMSACLEEFDRLHYYVRSSFRTFALQSGGIQNLGKKYDVGFSIFHLQRHNDPIAVGRRMKSICRQRVFGLTPYEEAADTMTPGHKSRIDDAVLEAIGAEAVEVFPSPAWGASSGQKVVRFIVKGNG